MNIWSISVFISTTWYYVVLFFVLFFKLPFIPSNILLVDRIFQQSPLQFFCTSHFVSLFLFFLLPLRLSYNFLRTVSINGNGPVIDLFVLVERGCYFVTTGWISKLSPKLFPRIIYLHASLSWLLLDFLLLDLSRTYEGERLRTK